jgi:hypothetical protein
LWLDVEYEKQLPAANVVGVHNSAVRVVANMSTSPITTVESTVTPPTQGLADLKVDDTSIIASSDVPAHRSHDPAKNLKRTDPFQFGSRYLEAGDDVFEFNAWDHVETDDAYKEHAERQFELQRQSPVSDFDKCKYHGKCCSRLITLRCYDDHHPYA